MFFADRARENLEKILNGDQAAAGRHHPNIWRRQFVHEVGSAAEEFGISGLLPADKAEQSEATLDIFNAQLARVMTRLRLKVRGKTRLDTAQLTFETKTTIRSSLDDVRDRINRSNLSEDAKAALHRRVDAVDQELDRNRSSLRPLWILAGALAAASPTAIGAAADLPGAVQTVQSAMQLAHADRAAEIMRTAKFAPPRLGRPQETKLITDRTE